MQDEAQNRGVNAPKKSAELKKSQSSNAQKIQFLLDQRKPPLETLPSLCAQFDEELEMILDADI